MEINKLGLNLYLLLLTVGKATQEKKLLGSWPKIVFPFQLFYLTINILFDPFL